ncbi:MAG TPA: hypothetical protein VMX33_02770 [bacterium]|nr:hypothetical protein [bacterium]
MIRRSLVFVGSFALASIIVSCPAPIMPDIVASARDAIPPAITVASPAEYASYSRTLAITGVVTDMATEGHAGKVSELSYEILSHTAAKEAVLGANGSFAIEEPNDLRENIVVLLKATDWNGNQSEYRLPLVFPGNEIPSFTAIEGNRQTTVSWDPVPGVVSYTLYVEPSAKTPDPAISPSIAGVSSPFTMGQLKNASLYSLLLEGQTADGRKNYSAVVRSVPLSSLHLLPQATSSFGGIELRWRVVASIPLYNVLRAASPDGPWEDVSGPVPGPVFFDQGAVRGNTYFYAIKPASSSSVMSDWIEASVDSVASRADAAVASYDAVEFSRASEWRDGYVYIADYYYGLRILDVRVPELPREVSSIPMTQPSHIAVDGNYAYLSSWRSLVIVDISNPAAPNIVSTLSLGIEGGDFYAEGLAVLGDLVFVAGFNEGFVAIDVGNRAAPVLRGTYRDKAIFGQNYDVAVSERGSTDVLVVTGNNASALYTVDGTASNPTIVRVSSALPYGRSAAFNGTVLLLSSNASLYAYQTSTPASPTLLDSEDPTGNLAQTGSVYLYGSRAFVALGSYGYAVIDITIPAALRTVSIRTVPGDTEHVSVGGGNAFVSTGQGYPFQIVGANDPSSARIILTRTDVATGARLAAFRDYLYVSESGSGDWAAASYDISNPAATFRSNSPIGSYTPYSFSFAGARTYVASERSGIMMWNNDNPGSPAVMPPWYVGVQGGYAWAIAITGNYALVGTSNSWLNAVDLSRQGALTVVGSTQSQGSPSSTTEIRGIAINGNLAFVANEAAGLRVVDITDPGLPVALSGFGKPYTTGQFVAVATAKDYVLVADTLDGLAIFDSTNVRSWSAAGQARIWFDPARGPAYDVVVRGNYAYVARGAAGLDIWDIANPLAPAKFSTLTQAGFSPTALIVYKDHLYALDGATKLYVVELVP